MSDDFSILCVCTGNICRSPAAERLLAVALGREVQVSSAGTLALVGRAVHPPMDSLVVLGGGDVSGFAARQLRESMLRDADLVLTMTDAHTGKVLEMWPRALRKTFTLGGFARLLGYIDPASLPAGGAADRLRAAIPLAIASRRPGSDRTVDDVVDPFRQADDVFEAAFDSIHAAVATIADLIVLDRDQERR